MSNQNLDFVLGRIDPNFEGIQRRCRVFGQFSHRRCGLELAVGVSHPCYRSRFDRCGCFAW